MDIMEGSVFYPSQAVIDNAVIKNYVTLKNSGKNRPVNLIGSGNGTKFLTEAIHRFSNGL